MRAELLGEDVSASSGAHGWVSDKRNHGWSPMLRPLAAQRSPLFPPPNCHFYTMYYANLYITFNITAITQTTGTGKCKQPNGKSATRRE